MQQNKPISLEDLYYGGTLDRFLTDEEIENILSIAKITGGVEEIETYCKNKVYLVNYSATDHLLIIPSNVKYISHNSTKAIGRKYDTPRGFCTDYEDTFGSRWPGEHIFKNCFWYIIGIILGGIVSLIGGIINIIPNALRELSYHNEYLLKIRICIEETRDKIEDTLSDLMGDRIGEWLEEKFDFDAPTLCDKIRKAKGNLQVIGGSGLRDISEMFRECNFTKLDLRLLDTSNVESMCGMFLYCYADEIDLSKTNTSNVKNMRYMFARCNTKVLDLSSFDTNRVKTMFGMFAGCEAESLNIRAFQMKNVKYFKRMFTGCTALIKVLDPILIDMLRKDENKIEVPAREE